MSYIKLLKVKCSKLFSKKVIKDKDMGNYLLCVCFFEIMLVKYKLKIIQISCQYLQILYHRDFHFLKVVKINTEGSHCCHVDTVQIMVFKVITPYILISEYQHYVVTCVLYIYIYIYIYIYTSNLSN